MKGERVAQFELLLRSHPEGLRRAEIARRLGVHRSTISRYVEDLKDHIDIYEDNNLIKIRTKDNEEGLALSIYESLAFNMSAEALLNSTGMQNPHLASGLRKLALSMQSYAPKIADNMRLVADKMDDEIQKNRLGNTRYSAILERLIDAWVSGRILKLEVRKEEALDEIELAPYFIGFRDEDNSRSPITVTGRLRHTTQIITIDISKIESAMLLEETYTIPDNLKPFKINPEEKSYDAIDMIPLRLKLSEKSAANSFTTLIHGAFNFINQPDGSMILEFAAENSIELMLRLVQCGTSVEILSPESYRRKFISVLKNIIAIYE
jgi:IclR helix-turn-helix domain.